MSISNNAVSKEYKYVIDMDEKIEKLKSKMIFNKIELIYIIIFPFGCWQYLYCESFRNFIHYNILFHLNDMLGFVLLSISVICSWACIRINDKSKNDYQDETYATLRSERDEYAIFGGIASLFLFALKEMQTLELNDYRVGIIFASFHFLFLISIYYRHHNYTIYMLEAKKPHLKITIEQIKEE